MVDHVVIGRNNNPSVQGDSDRMRYLREILIVFAPLATLGVIGMWIGNGTLVGGGIVNLAYLLSSLLAIFVSVRLRGAGWGSIGLARPRSWRRTLLLSVGTAVAAMLVSVVIQVIAVNLPGIEVPPIDESRFDPYEGSILGLILLLIVTWTTTGFGEEILWRGFLLGTIAGLFHNSKLGWAIAVAVSSVLFGMIHYVAGPLAIVSIAGIGLVFALAYLGSGRNLWITIIAHALLNTIRFILVFAGAA